MKMSFDLKYNYPQIARDSGFKIRQFKDGPLDWRLVGSLEVERILREQQFEDIDSALFYLSEAPLAPMLESNILETGIAKHFILSQLAIQYLLFCRKFLDETVRTLRETLMEVEVENVSLKATNQEHSNEIVHLHKKISQIESIHNVVFPCHFCTKNFISNDALNIHLSKKHSKNSPGDLQGKDDRTLINTIKLELEIKQLKERLNIAEKDIRETIESKRSTPREVAKMCSSTQMSTTTIQTGIQCNLLETKENDCTEESNPDKLEILSQLYEKISKLESRQATHSPENSQLNEITLKLSEITKSLETKPEVNGENLIKLVKDAVLASIPSKQTLETVSAEELHSLLFNTFSDVLHSNSEKLNEISSQIQTICNEKVPVVEVEKVKKKPSAEQSVQVVIPAPTTVTVLPPKREVVCNEKVPVVEVEKVKKKPSAEQSVQVAVPAPTTVTVLPPKREVLPLEEKQFSSPSTRRTYSIEMPVEVPVMFTNDVDSVSSSTDMSQQILDLQKIDSDDGHSLKSLEEDVEGEMVLPSSSGSQTVLAAFEKKLAHYGINASAKTMSSSDAGRISAQLADKRSSLKKIYPRFYATRNKLKDFVHQISSKKLLDRQRSSENLVQSKPKNSTPRNPTKPKSKNSASELSSVENDSNNEAAAFKRRLEKILSSPIKKPIPYVPKEAIKPVPIPRKRVMFSNAGKQSTNDHVSPTFIRS